MLPIFNGMGSPASKRRRRMVQQWPYADGSPPIPDPIVSQRLGTTLIPSSDTVVTYVDQVDGSDANDGKWPIQYASGKGPKKTFAGGYAILRTGHNDWLLFRRGQTWTGADLGTALFAKSGASAGAPIVIGAYGDPSQDEPKFAGDAVNVPVPINHDTGITSVVIAHGQIQAGDAIDSVWNNDPFSVTLGWTIFTRSVDSIVTYVADVAGGGDNAHDGLWPGVAGTTWPDIGTVPAGAIHGPKLTIAAAAAQLRHLKPDWLLLKRGCTWDERLVDGIVNGYWVKAGRSSTEPLVIGTYGDASVARPILRTGTNKCFESWNNQHQGVYCGNLVITGIECYPHTWTGGSENPVGVTFRGGSDSVLVEDCYVHGYNGNVVIGTNGHHGAGVCTNYIVRRNVIANAWTAVNGNGAQGMFVSDVNGILIEENCFVHNGWDDAQSGSQKNFFVRNVYVQNAYPEDGSVPANVVFRENVMTGTDGIQLRPGGTCENNLIVQASAQEGIQFGSGNEPATFGVQGGVRGNVLLDGNDIGPTVVRGWGLVLGNDDGVTASYNLIANNTHGTSPRPITLNFDNGHGNPWGQHNTTLDHNIVYGWGTTGSDFPPDSAGSMVSPYQNNIVENLVLTNNDFYNNVDTTAGSKFNMLFVRANNVGSQAELAAICLPGHGSNRYFRTGATGAAANAYLFRFVDSTGVGVNYNFADAMALIGDVTSAYAHATYPDPAKMIGDWHVAAGSTVHGVTSLGTLAKYEEDLLLQRNGAWDIQLMPTHDKPDTAIAEGFYATMVANGLRSLQVNGPLRYFRANFTDTTNKFVTMGMRVTGALSPAVGTHNGGTAVTITGSGFIRAGSNATDQTSITIVKFDGTDAGDVIVVSDTSITCTTPAGAAGAVDVKVDNGEGLYTVTGGFTYT